MFFKRTFPLFVYCRYHEVKGVQSSSNPSNKVIPSHLDAQPRSGVVNTKHDALEVGIMWPHLVGLPASYLPHQALVFLSPWPRNQRHWTSLLWHQHYFWASLFRVQTINDVTTRIIRYCSPGTDRCLLRKVVVTLSKKTFYVRAGLAERILEVIVLVQKVGRDVLQLYKPQTYISK